MKAVIQRVENASVEVLGEIKGKIERGLLILLGVENGDTELDADFIAKKCCEMRVFEDENGKMNLALKDIGGKILAVSQFTLAGNLKKGRRPSFDDAAPPEIANELYEYFCKKTADSGIPIEKGIFQSHMRVQLINDGPVTFILDSRA